MNFLMPCHIRIFSAVVYGNFIDHGIGEQSPKYKSLLVIFKSLKSKKLVKIRF